MNDQWLQPITKILSLESADLRSLAESVGANAQNFYVWQDLSQCDLRGQDLRGMNLTGTNISKENVDGSTLIDRVFDPIFRFEDEYVSIRLSHELLSFIYAYAERRSYAYKAWAIKALLELGLSNERSKSGYYKSVIDNNDSFLQILSIEQRNYRLVRTQVYSHYQERVFQIARSRFRGENKPLFGELIFEGLLSDQIGANNQRMFTDVSFLPLYARSRHYLDKIVNEGL